jgi:hypothetical protein
LIKNPGPGSYDKPPAPVKHVGQGMKAVREANLWDVKITPAPGQYEENVAEQLAKCVLLRTGSPAFKDRAVRGHERVEPGPGPAFKPKLPKTAAAKFPKQERFTETNFCGTQKLSQVPAPAEYSVDTETTRKRVTGGEMMSRSRFARETRKPTVGPGTYGEFSCEMIKPSFNVAFDPGLKRNRPFRMHYD